MNNNSIPAIYNDKKIRSLLKLVIVSQNYGLNKMNIILAIDKVLS